MRIPVAVHRSPARLLALLALLTALIGGCLVLTPTAAWAHDELVGADPEPGGVVDALPAQLVLTYSGELIADAGTAELVVTGPDGDDLAEGEPIIDGRLVTQALRPADITGTVTVVWKVVSGDGHPISDTFVFGVGEEPSGPATGTETEVSADVPWQVIWIPIIVLVLVAGGGVAYVLAMRARRRSE